MNKCEFSDLYAECRDHVWKLVSKYGRSQEDREDLFQEVFVRIHKALPRFRGESAVATWVYRITVNTSLNYVKKQNRYRWLKNILDNFRGEEADLLEVDEEAVLLQPLNKLNPRQKMVLLLADVEEKKLEEIALLLKLPLGTIKSNLHRAREIVKKEVTKNGK